MTGVLISGPPWYAINGVIGPVDPTVGAADSIRLIRCLMIVGGPAPSVCAKAEPDEAMPAARAAATEIGKALNATRGRNRPAAGETEEMLGLEAILFILLY